MAKILITSIGTLGDINPAIALGKRLRVLGHKVDFASCSFYLDAVEAAGLTFHRVRPDYNPKDEELCKAIMHPVKTLLNIHKMILTPAQLEASFQDFLALAPGYDLVMGNIFSYSSRAACEKQQVPWVGLHLSPVCFFSLVSPPALYPFTAFVNLPKTIRIKVFSFLYSLMNLVADTWAKNVFSLYKRHDIPAPRNTMIDAPFSDHLNLALFSPLFFDVSLERQQARGVVKQIGFLDYSGEGSAELPNDLREFLEHEEAPLFFTFGSTSGLVGEREMLEPIFLYLQQNKRRTVISVSSSFKNKYQHRQNERLIFCEFVPYLVAMPKMKMVIHQGGVGTTSIAMSSGIPQLILPDCTDQYDNAYRASLLGVARSLPRKNLNAENLEGELSKILNDPSYFEKAKKLKEDLSLENQLEDQNEKIKEAIDLALFNNRHRQP